MIVNGDLDEVAEQTFYMRGGIEEVIAEGEKFAAVNA
jgi:F0F1-type ATP synthase beta subunit